MPKKSRPPYSSEHVINPELEELKRWQNSTSVWKLHADSLVVLLDLARRLSEAVERLELQVAQHDEMHTRNNPLRDSIKKLHERTDRAANLLSQS